MELLAATLALGLTKMLSAVELLVEEMSTLEESVRLLVETLLAEQKRLRIHQATRSGTVLSLHRDWGPTEACSHNF